VAENQGKDRSTSNFRFDKNLDPATRNQFSITGITQIADQNDLDCLIKGQEREWRMDLVEFVPDDLSAGGYATAKSQRTNGDIADRLLQQVEAKGVKYGVDTPWLLIYSTAYQFPVSQNAMHIVSNSLLQNPPKFERVMYMRVHDDNVASITTIYPVTADIAQRLQNTDIAALRANVVTGVDMRKLKREVDEKGGVSYYFPE
jgi:hypothetical protein